MSFEKRAIFTIRLLAVFSAVVILAFTVAESYGLGLGVLERILANPAYWFASGVVGWLLAPKLARLLAARRERKR